MARHFGAHAMIGRGGEMRVPVSESDALADIGNLLDKALPNMVARDSEGVKHARRLVAEAIKGIDALREQVKGGYHRNPSSSRLYEPFKIVALLGREVDSIAYIHATENKPYEHDFQRGSAEVYAVERHGRRELLIVSPKRVPLWDEF